MIAARLESAIPATNAVCNVCGKAFRRVNSLHVVCGFKCANKVPALNRRLERQETKRRKEAIKTRSQWMLEAQAAVNKWARLRDVLAGRGCVSCGEPYRGAYGGAFDAGHYRSVGSAPHLRMYLPQIALQCVRCNRHLGGNAVEFRRGLVARIGLDAVEAIEAMQFTAKHDIAYLTRLKHIANKRARRLQRRIEIGAN